MAASPRDRYAEFVAWREQIYQYQAMRNALPQMPAEAYPPPRAALPKADTMGPIRAWRLWKIDRERLWSVSQGTKWEPGIPMQGAPGPDDDAGVYAVKRREHPFQYRGDAVLGEVGLWGRVIEHEHGFRAEYAYPINLRWTRPCPMPGFPRPTAAIARLTALAEAYGIPLIVEDGDANKETP
jgi:hypothetical protein